MDYQAALERLLGLADFERASKSPTHAQFHLNRISLILERLGNPHLGIPTVHVAGTKGKGSTAAIIASVLSAQGYKAGLFTSPHLHTFRERIRIGDRLVSEEEFASLVEEIWPVIEGVGEKGGYGEVTTFELLTAMAFYYFQKQTADFQVIEAGLGGRLDTTNVVAPEICVLTSISLDHTATLGDTIELIAWEKAGIIKGGATVVVAPQRPEALQVFTEVSLERGAGLIDVGKEVSWQRGPFSYEGQSLEVEGVRGLCRLWIPLLGEHQLENTSTALVAVEALQERGFHISSESIEEGLRRVQWPARMEVLAHNGTTAVVDGAHNPYSMGRLVETIRDYFQFRRVVLIFGASGGHSAEEMVEELVALSPVVILSRSRHPRASPNDMIKDLFGTHGISSEFQSENVGEATRYALETAREGDLILATGSLFVAAEVRETIKGIVPELYPSLQRAPGVTRPLV